MRRAIVGAFEGLVAAVTCGGSGIGAACAAGFVREAGRVGVLDLNPPEATDGILPIRANVADGDELDAAMAQIAAEFGGIDILVNSAGISGPCTPPRKALCTR
jgi:NAD(P)-dependent dehydrogenase (short-subunit alcohol dehydrogenase family)